MTHSSESGRASLVCMSSKLVFLQVGFESAAFQLMDIKAGTSQVMVSRKGTYGMLSVAWTTGYAPGSEIPEPIVIGNMTPTLGEFSLQPIEVCN